MWSPHSEPEPIEKIRKAQWTVENTRKTQQVVNGLVQASRSLRNLHGRTALVDVIELAIQRFREMDPGVDRVAVTQPAQTQAETP